MKEGPPKSSATENVKPLVIRSACAFVTRPNARANAAIPTLNFEFTTFSLRLQSTSSQTHHVISQLLYRELGCHKKSAGLPKT